MQSNQTFNNNLPDNVCQQLYQYTAADTFKQINKINTNSHLLIIESCNNNFMIDKMF